MADRRVRAVELLMHAISTVHHDDALTACEELVDLLLPEEPKPIDPMGAGARLVAAARLAYHTERESAIASFCTRADVTREQQDATWQARAPEYFDVYRELAEALEPFGGVGPKPEEDEAELNPTKEE